MFLIFGSSFLYFDLLFMADSSYLGIFSTSLGLSFGVHKVLFPVLSLSPSLPWINFGLLHFVVSDMPHDAQFSTYI